MIDGRIKSEKIIENHNNEMAAGMPSFVSDWYLNMKASRKTAATCGDYLTKIRRFLTSINDDINSVTLNDINETTVTQYYLSVQTKETPQGIVFTSDSYQLTVWCCLDNFLGYLERVGKIKRNYIRDINKPKNHDLDRINENRVLLTDEDFKKIINAVESEKNPLLRKRDKALIIMFMSTGLRRTAMASLLISNINFEDKTLHVIDKGSKRHDFVLNHTVCRALNEWLAVRKTIFDSPGVKRIDEGYLFVSERGNGMSGNTIAYTVKKYTDIALCHAISPHKLRSGFCSILYSKTHDIEFVRRAVGHANAATTQRYIVTKGEEKKKAAEIMDSLL